ncbi:MAG: diphthamide biosynthesis enzyme Dph2 [Methanosarcinales archaeon]
MNHIDDYDFDINNIIAEIQKRNTKTIGLQFPEGLKRQGIKIANLIEKETETTVLISGNPCYGACDLDTKLCDLVDILLHFGHAEINLSKSNKVIFIELRSNIDVLPVVKKSLELLKHKRIGLITTVQHVHKLKEVKEYLEEKNYIPIIKSGDSRVKYRGQVLGCNFSAASANCEEYLYIGSGNFHPLGVKLATGKRVIVADPFTQSVHEVDTKKILKQRSAIIAKSLDAKTWGILVSTKIGQMRLELAKKLQILAKQHNKDSYVIVLDLITPESLINFKMDAYVNTACPRIAIDDISTFPVPVLTPIEFEIVLGERDWNIVFDEICGSFDCRMRNAATPQSEIRNPKSNEVSKW